MRLIGSSLALVFIGALTAIGCKSESISKAIVVIGDTSSGIGTTGVRLELYPKNLDCKPTETFPFKATVYNTADKRVLWSSTNNAVVTVDQSGLARCIAAGQANIWAKAFADSTAAQTALVVVHPVVVEMPIDSTLTLTSSGSITLACGANSTITWTTSPAGLTVALVSGNTGIATVNSNGVITGVASGTTVITGSVVGKASSRFTVNVTVPQCSTTNPNPNPGGSIGGLPSTIDAQFGTGNCTTPPKQLTPTTAPVANSPITWSFSNPGVAQIDGAFKLAFLSVGTTDLKATTKEGGVFTIHIVVTACTSNNPTVVSIIIDDPSSERFLHIGQYCSLTQSFGYKWHVVNSDGSRAADTYQIIDFSVSPLGIVNVDGNGMATLANPPHTGRAAVTLKVRNAPSVTTVTNVTVDDQACNPPQPSIQVTLNPGFGASCNAGGTLAVSANVIQNGVAVAGTGGTWLSSDPSVASIGTIDAANNKATLNCIKAGSTEMSYTYSGVAGKQTYKVNAVAQPNPTITINNCPSTMKVGDKVKLTATLNPVPPDPTVVWSGNNNLVAAINGQTGELTAYTPGVVTVYANWQPNIAVQAACPQTVVTK